METKIVKKIKKKLCIYKSKCDMIKNRNNVYKARANLIETLINRKCV